jgi:hypothetical protein
MTFIHDEADPGPKPTRAALTETERGEGLSVLYHSHEALKPGGIDHA